MSYSEPLINQVKVLFFSIGVGILLGLIYTLIQGSFRLLGKGRLSYFAADGLFVSAFFLLSFFFMVLYNNGRVRFHLIIGEGVGFWLFYYSTGRYIYAVFEKGAVIIRRLIKVFLKPYIIIFTSFFGKIKCLLKQIYKRIHSRRNKKSPQAENDQKKDRKNKIFGKIHLKNPNK